MPYRMEHNEYGIMGNSYLLITIFFQVMGMIVWAHIWAFIPKASGFLSIVTAVMAIRYYWYATKKQKEK